MRRIVGPIAGLLLGATVWTAAASAHASYLSEVLADGPIAYYRLDETNGTLALDASGNGRVASNANGVAQGAAGLTAGGTACSYDGLDDQTTRSGDAGFVPGVFTDNMGRTLEAWVKIAPGNAYGAGFIAWYLQSGQAPTYQLMLDGSGRAKGWVRDNTGNAASITNSADLRDGEWHHVVLTFGHDGANSPFRLLYVDGALGASNTTTALTAISGGSADLTIGWFNGYNPDDRFFSGSLDEVAVYNRALSPARVRAHFEAGRGVPSPLALPRDLTVDGAILNGMLLSTGMADSAVAVFWGQQDRGATSSGWDGSTNWAAPQQAGAFSCEVALTAATDYTYRFAASNAMGWAFSEPQRFRTSPGFGGWQRRMPIVFSGYTPSARLTNFPALVVLGPHIPRFRYGDFLSGGQADLAFTMGRRVLDYEIESWNTSERSHVWVQLPILTNCTTVTAFWGHPGLAPLESTTSRMTWEDGFAGVWHLGATNSAGQLPDSSSNANGFALSGTTEVSGRIGLGRGFGGSDYASAGDVLDEVFAGANQTFTWEGWVRPASNMMNNPIIGKIGASGHSPPENNREFGLRVYTANKLEFFYYGALAGTSYRGIVGQTAISDTSRWYHVAATYDGTQAPDSRVALYVDGRREVATVDLTLGTPAAIPNGAAHLGLGAFLSSTGQPVPGCFAGAMDEIRLSRGLRSSNWFWACRLNVVSNGSSFPSYGPIIGATAGARILLR